MTYFFYRWEFSLLEVKLIGGQGDLPRTSSVYGWQKDLIPGLQGQTLPIDNIISHKHAEHHPKGATPNKHILQRKNTAAY